MSGPICLGFTAAPQLFPELRKSRPDSEGESGDDLLTQPRRVRLGLQRAMPTGWIMPLQKDMWSATEFANFAAGAKTLKMTEPDIGRNKACALPPRHPVNTIIDHRGFDVRKPQKLLPTWETPETAGVGVLDGDRDALGPNESKEPRGQGCQVVSLFHASPNPRRKPRNTTRMTSVTPPFSISSRKRGAWSSRTEGPDEARADPSPDKLTQTPVV